MIGRALTLLRRDPLLPVLLLSALVVPPLLGLVPLDRALALLIDLRPAARGLTATPLDDSLLRALISVAPTLHGTLAGGLAAALLLSPPAVWLIEGAIAGAALDRGDARWACGRGLGISLLALVPRTLLGAATTAIAWGPDHETWGSRRDALIVAFALSTVLGAMLTVLIDVARGHAVATERGLALCFGDAVGSIGARFRAYLQLVGLELVSVLACVAAVALTRPLGLFHAVMWLVGMLALCLRALVMAAIVAAAAALTGAASRSA